jgi:hypothetical protein
MWGYTPVIPTLSKLRQEDCEFESSLGEIARFYLKKGVEKEERKGPYPHETYI